MNFKFFFPTFRNRYLFVRSQIKQLSKQVVIDTTLNLGTGEGDYDRMLASYSRHLIGVDVNEEDLVHARNLNKSVLNLRYETNNALALSYPDESFDLVVSSEVIEHVGQPEKMVQEIFRVLKPGGHAILTFPSREFPFTYDPINRIWQWIGRFSKKENLIAQGAYAFGHEYLIGSKDFKQWATHAGFEIPLFRNLSGPIIGLMEVYWTGIAQSIFKKNSRNVTSDSDGQYKMRPDSTKEPRLVFLTDALIWFDDWLFHYYNRSVGKGVVLRKKF